MDQLLRDYCSLLANESDFDDDPIGGIRPKFTIGNEDTFRKLQTLVDTLEMIELDCRRYAAITFPGERIAKYTCFTVVSSDIPSMLPVPTILGARDMERVLLCVYQRFAKILYPDMYEIPEHVLRDSSGVWFVTVHRSLKDPGSERYFNKEMYRKRLLEKNIDPSKIHFNVIWDMNHVQCEILRKIPMCVKIFGCPDTGEMRSTKWQLILQHRIPLLSRAVIHFCESRPFMWIGTTQFYNISQKLKLCDKLYDSKRLQDDELANISDMKIIPDKSRTYITAQTDDRDEVDSRIDYGVTGFDERPMDQIPLTLYRFECITFVDTVCERYRIDFLSDGKQIEAGYKMFRNMERDTANYNWHETSFHRPHHLLINEDLFESSLGMVDNDGMLVLKTYTSMSMGCLSCQMDSGRLVAHRFCSEDCKMFHDNIAVPVNYLVLVRP